MTFNIGNQISGFCVPRGWAADTLASQTQRMRVFLYLAEEEIDGAVLGIFESHIRCHEADASSLGSGMQPEKAQNSLAAVLRGDFTPHPSGFSAARADGVWPSRAESPGQTLS